MFLFVFYVHYADIALDSGTDPEPIDIIKNYFNYGELRDNKGRHPRRDRLFFYGSRLVTRQIKRGDEDSVLAPVKVI